MPNLVTALVILTIGVTAVFAWNSELNRVSAKCISLTEQQVSTKGVTVGQAYARWVRFEDRNTLDRYVRPMEETYGISVAHCQDAM
jgi:hypothetical protein